MKKFSKISAILASVAILGVSAFATITYAKGENKPTVTAAETSESNSSSIDGCTIVMRSFYAGYIINDSDIDAIKAEAANDDNPNRKNLKEIINALDNGQHYDDTDVDEQLEEGAEVAHLVLFEGHHACDEEDQEQLGHLGGLELSDAWHAEPAAAQGEHHNENHRRGPIAQQGEAGEVAVVDARKENRRQPGGSHDGHVAQEERRGGLAGILGVGIESDGAVDLDERDDGQQQEEDPEGTVATEYVGQFHRL